jgi:hypothetical protein
MRGKAVAVVVGILGSDLVGVNLEGEKIDGRAIHGQRHSDHGAAK